MKKELLQSNELCNMENETIEWMDNIFEVDDPKLAIAKKYFYCCEPRWDIIEEVKIDDLQPFPNHEKYFPELTTASFKGLMSSIHEKGLLKPILITKNKIIISGHERVRACRALGMDTIKAWYICWGNPTAFSEDDIMKYLFSSFLSSNCDKTQFPLYDMWRKLYFGDMDKHIKEDMPYSIGKTEKWYQAEKERIIEEVKEKGFWTVKM